MVEGWAAGGGLAVVALSPGDGVWPMVMIVCEEWWPVVRVGSEQNPI